MAVDVTVHCEGFTDPRLLLTCPDGECEWPLRGYRAGKTVTKPERYSCGDCGSDDEVRHCESGRTWRTNDGYGGAGGAGRGVVRKPAVGGSPPYWDAAVSNVEIADRGVTQVRRPSQSVIDPARLAAGRRGESPLSPYSDK